MCYKEEHGVSKYHDFIKLCSTEHDVSDTLNCKTRLETVTSLILLGDIMYGWLLLAEITLGDIQERLERLESLELGLVLDSSGLYIAGVVASRAQNTKYRNAMTS